MGKSSLTSKVPSSSRADPILWLWWGRETGALELTQYRDTHGLKTTSREVDDGV
jgi:hypothetical protein